MKQPDKDEGTELRGYLLGDLDEESRLRLEGRLLTDGPFFEELLVAEDELLDEYLRGALNAPERERFETHFLCAPERRRKLSFARALRKYVADAGQDAASPATQSDDAAHVPVWARFLPSFLRAQPPALAFSLAVALLLAAVGGLWFVYRNSNGLASAERELAELNNQQNEIRTTRGGSTSEAVYAAVLRPGLVRSAGETTRLKIPAAAEVVRLSLELPGGDYESYRAQLEATGGAPARPFPPVNDLKARPHGDGRIVIVQFPSRFFSAGDYQVRLGGRTPGGEFEEVAAYNFRVLPE